MKRKFTDPILSSNILFLVNALLYAHKNYMMCFFSMFLAFLTSCGYHYYKEQDEFWKSLDIVAATNALLITLFYAQPFFEIIDVLVCSLLLLIAFIFKHIANEKSYSWHVLWHIFVFIGQCYLWYILD